METIAAQWDLLLHLDVHLASLVQQYGTGVYLILFLIVFCETGLVITPFLPGDSLLFVSGAIWAAAGMDVTMLATALICAALLGDNCNYWIGRQLGPRVFRLENSRLLNRAALERTQAFYERHGGKTIVLARFIPLVRTFAPFVAGIGRMPYPRFMAFSIGGALLWVLSLTWAGYYFGNIPWVKQNLTLVIFGIIGVSLLPVAHSFVKARWGSLRAS
jgi:membrane-associated protein